MQLSLLIKLFNFVNKLQVLLFEIYKPEIYCGGLWEDRYKRWKYVPELAELIIDRNYNPSLHIDLKGILLGNPETYAED